MKTNDGTANIRDELPGNSSDHVNDGGADNDKQGSHYSSSSDESYSSDSDSVIQTSSDDDSVGSSSSDGSSGGSYSSDNSSHASSQQPSTSRSSDNSNTSSSQHAHRSRISSLDQSSAPLSNNSNLSQKTNYSTNRIFRLAPQPNRGIDQNCDPNSRSTTLIHRRGGKSSKECDDDDDLDSRKADDDCDNGRNKRGSSRHRRRHDHRRGKSSRHNKRDRKSKSINCCIKYICCQTKKRSTQILILAFAIWILVQCYYFYYWSYDHRGGRGLSGRGGGRIANQSGGHFNHSDVYQTRSPEEMNLLREQRMKEARAALGTGAGDDFDHAGFRRDSGGKLLKPNNRRSKGGRKGSRDSGGSSRLERLSDGCSALEWHSYHFPNCNDVHDIDLRSVVRSRRSRKKDNNSTATPWGFVGNGLWRDVFSCDPREEMVAAGSDALTPPLPPAVLKIMKSEHPYNQRNFQRHRRDALVMERLSSSHHLVPIYGYCANTVLTQAISHTLDDVIYARENERVKKWSPHGGYQTKPPLESWMGKDENGELVATRETELGRIRLALGVFRGLMDLHEGDGTSNMEWLPIVHADLQSKQYLVDAQTGQIYLNDFNRCRFLAKKDRPTNATSKENSNNGNGSSLESCPLHIPTAPGAARSPEEYNLAPLSEKLDIYSAGNILYAIITGNRPWNGERGKHVKTGIQKGKRPQVNDTIRNAEGTGDAELTRLLDRVYEGDPNKRASAKEIVRDLERLLDRELKK
ncbi:hypothetical protein ACHAXR_003575, partial [Thalassiosira sp. AJA248-18]